MQIKKKLLDIVREKIRVKHYSIKTEQSYVGWVKQYIVNASRLNSAISQLEAGLGNTQKLIEE